MKLSLSKKPFLLLGLAGLLFFPASFVFAEDYQTCQCSGEEAGWAPTCEQCLRECLESAELALPSSRTFEDTSSCGGPDPDLGGVICNCSFRAVIPASGSCLLTDWRCAGELILEIPIEEGQGCSRQEDCSGTSGTCGADRCFCNPETSRCKYKKDSGSVCLENFECHSNICTAVPGGEGKTCKLGGLTPGGETPPQTEGEDFPTYQLKSPIGEVTGPELIGRIIKAVLGIVGALALAMFVFGGFTWLTSGGSPDKIKKGKDILMWAVIGLIIIFTSYTLVDFILTAFGL